MKTKPLTFIFLIASLLTAFLVSSVVAQVRGIVPVPIKNPQGEQVLLYKESYALVVGVSAYEKGWPTLPGVLKDVELVKYALEEKDFHVITVINPSFDELRNAIEKFIHSYGQQEDNRLLFYFAGHGHTLKLSYGDEMGYFVPVNAPNPNRDESGFLAKSLNMELIEVFAKQIQAKHALFLFDSCFSGSIFALSRAIPANINYKTSEPVRQFITAGSANETVPDESIFRDQFIRAIRGEGDADSDGYVTGVELGEFLQKAVVNYSKGSQHPQYGKIRNPNLDRGDFVFSLHNSAVSGKSIEALELEKINLVRERERLEDKRKRLELEKELADVKRELEVEKKKLANEEKNMEIASLPQSKKIAYVNIQKALSATNEWKNLFNLFKAEFEKEKAKIKKMELRINELREGAEFRQQKKDFEQYVKDKNNEFGLKEKEMTQKALQKMLKVIAQLSKEHQVTIIEKKTLLSSGDMHSNYTDLATKTYNSIYQVEETSFFESLFE